jgi:hypothetical protein
MQPNNHEGGTMATKKGYRTTTVQLAESSLALRGSQKLVNAVETLTGDMNLYEGVRFSQILEAVYAQGRKDGARAVFEQIDSGVKTAKRAIPYKNPGRPRKEK